MSRDLRDADYLAHIEDAIARIDLYVAGKAEEDFLEDPLTQDGVIRNLEVIGEAVTKLSNGIRKTHSDVPWGEIAGMRNRLIHGYMTVNLEIVWSTVERVLPDFLVRVRTIRQSLERSPGRKD